MCKLPTQTTTGYLVDLHKSSIFPHFIKIDLTNLPFRVIKTKLTICQKPSYTDAQTYDVVNKA